MQYVEMSLEEANAMCKKNVKVLVATQDLTNDEKKDIIFVPKRENEYEEIFRDVKSVFSLYDDFVKQLKLFTEKQDIRCIKPYGLERIVLLRE